MGFWGRLFGREYHATGEARPFRMDIEEVFFITGRGTVATGTVSTGILSVGDAVEVHKADGTRLAANVTGIEAFRKIQTSAHPGQMVGVLLDSVTRHDLAKGDTLEA